MEGYQEEIFKEKIISYLKILPKNTGFTLAEVVIHTGIAIDWAEYTLRQLMNEYPVYVEINDNNELIYFFDLNPKPLSLAKTFGNGLKWLYKSAWWLTKISFKAWILTMLLTYFLFNFVVILGITIAIAGEGGGALIEGIFSLLGKIFGKVGGFFLKMLGWDFDKQIEANKALTKKKLELAQQGNTEEQIIAKIKEEQQKQKNQEDILHQIYSYVFGSTDIDTRNAEYWERQSLKLIEAQQGLLYASDLVKLQGISLHNARLHATKLVARHRGEISVNDKGVITYYFPELITQNTNETPPPIWENPIPLEKMNDNDNDTNQSIAWINGFNVLMSFISTFAIQFAFYGDANMPDWILVLSLVVPFLFSVTFFTIPLLRKPAVYWRNLKIKKQNNTANTYKRIFEQLKENKENKEQKSLLAQNHTEEQIFNGLEGIPHPQTDGKVTYNFPDVEQELQ